MGSGGGQQTQTQRETSAPWLGAQPFAKAYLDAMAGLIFPGMTQPSNYLPKGWNFGQGQAGGAGGAGGGGQQIATPGLDPTLAYNFLNPMIGGSNYLQNMFAQNPGAITSAASPAAFNQLQQLYGSMGAG